ncbi:MAG: coenzyme pyrophosphatase, partial [Cryobacterium sp.]|nr:coenzyme pyrophosphatase [Cryobacterium sp.]
MLDAPNDPRAELIALCQRGLDWHTGRSRVLPDSSQARRAAVLVLFGVLDAVPAHALVPAPVRNHVPADLDVLLLRRAATLGSHPGQIAFPGGRVEASDADPTAAALRE